jgi:hypothetical protein
MKNSLLYFLLFSMLFTTVACSEDDPTAADSDKVETKDISRDGSIETLLTTTHKVWKGGVLVNTLLHTDTLPALGIDSNIKAADERGEATTATGKKDYEFYITVK